MAEFEFSVLPMLDSWDDKILNEYHKLGVSKVHYDIIDNDFYPGKGFNFEHLDDLKKIGFFITVHIMAKEAEKIIDRLINLPVDSITFQIEPFNNDFFKINSLIEKIKNANKIAGIAIQYDTDVNDYHEVLINCQLVTVMSVPPGSGGQLFNIEAIKNLKKIKDFKDSKNSSINIELDGGVIRNVLALTKDYVQFYVSGSYFYKLNNEEKKEFIKEISNN